MSNTRKIYHPQAKDFRYRFGEEGLRDLLKDAIDQWNEDHPERGKFEIDYTDLKPRHYMYLAEKSWEMVQEGEMIAQENEGNEWEFRDWLYDLYEDIIAKFIGFRLLKYVKNPKT